MAKVRFFSVSFSLSIWLNKVKFIGTEFGDILQLVFSHTPYSNQPRHVYLPCVEL